MWNGALPRERAGRDLFPSRGLATRDLHAVRPIAQVVWRYRLASVACWLIVVAIILQLQDRAGREARIETLLALGTGLLASYLLAARAQRIHEREMRTSLAALMETVAEQQARWETVIQSMADGVVVFDESGVVQAVNPAVVTLFGRPAAELLGRNAFTNPAWPVALSETVAYKAVFERETVPPQELRVQTTAGERVLSTNAAPLPHGKGAVAVFRDVTDMHALAQERVRVERLRVAGRIAGGLAHHFNNLLMVIMGRAQILTERAEVQSDPFLRRSIEAIQQAADDGAGTIERLREFTRPADRTTYQPVDLVQLVEDVIELTRPRWQYEKQSLGEYVTVEYLVRPELWVLGNARELREVLTNLMLNAVDAMPEGGTIRWGGWKGDHHAVLTLEDTGIGIADEQLPLIFEPFFTTKGSVGGGLGLSICQSIIEQHGGQISVHSEVGTGTTFMIRLPLTDLRPDKVAGPPVTSPIGRQRILYVDDDPAVTATFLELLLLEHHQVVTASSGAEALEIIERKAPTIVLTDLAMPTQNGIDLARTIHERWPHIPVGLVTGWGEDLSPEQRRVVQGILTKPVTREALREFLRALAPERSQEATTT